MVTVIKLWSLPVSLWWDSQQLDFTLHIAKGITTSCADTKCWHCKKNIKSGNVLYGLMLEEAVIPKYMSRPVCTLIFCGFILYPKNEHPSQGLLLYLFHSLKIKKLVEPITNFTLDVRLISPTSCFRATCSLILEGRGTFFLRFVLFKGLNFSLNFASSPQEPCRFTWVIKFSLTFLRGEFSCSLSKYWLWVNRAYNKVGIDDLNALDTAADPWAFMKRGFEWWFGETLVWQSSSASKLLTLCLHWPGEFNYNWPLASSVGVSAVQMEVRATLRAFFKPG